VLLQPPLQLFNLCVFSTACPTFAGAETRGNIRVPSGTSQVNLAPRDRRPQEFAHIGERLSHTSTALRVSYTPEVSYFALFVDGVIDVGSGHLVQMYRARIPPQGGYTNTMDAYIGDIGCDMSSSPGVGQTVH
jgi:hypothetical protein